MPTCLIRDAVHLVCRGKYLALLEEIDEDKVGGNTPLLSALLEMLAQLAGLAGTVAVDSVDVLGIGDEEIAVGGETLARLGIDHGLESWPLSGSVLVGLRISQFGNTGTVDDLSKLIGGGIVRVDKQNSNDLVGVGLHPDINLAQPILKCSSVKNIARGMT
ncbi:hypothetical protein HG531_011503 [Fusarium graminearum]|nr:hypothetical protein HG531_011503 [Fusarium graminearum]